MCVFRCVVWKEIISETVLQRLFFFQNFFHKNSPGLIWTRTPADTETWVSTNFSLTSVVYILTSLLLLTQCKTAPTHLVPI